MSFSFSVGDFLAAGKLIAEITSILSDASGSQSEYQELLRELEALDQALKHLDKLSSKTSSPALESIKFSALSCRRPLEQFLAKIKKYDGVLGVWGKGPNAIRRTAEKLKWAFGEKDGIRKIQSYLNVHVGTINILLAEHGLEMMSIAVEKGDADQMHIRERLENTQIQSGNAMLTRLFGMVNGEIRASWRSLADMVATVCVITQQIYWVVLEIKGSLSTVDTKWTFFQAPLMVEDALGYKFPVPSEYDFDLLDAIIKHRFQEGPGAIDVEVGNYELFHSKDSEQVLSKSSRILPGTSITMAIIISQSLMLGNEKCPKSRCKSVKTIQMPGGGRICCGCNVWFDVSKKGRKSLPLSDILGAILPIEQSTRSSEDPKKSKRRFTAEDDGTPSDSRRRHKISFSSELDNLKNVKFAAENSASEGTSSCVEDVPKFRHRATSDSRRKKRRNKLQDPKVEVYYIWRCCSCEESVSLGVRLDIQCASISCQHTRCQSCPLEELVRPIRS